MSVPLDQLYNYLKGIVDQDIIIYRWHPHGSRKLQDLGPLRDGHTNYTGWDCLLDYFDKIIMLCHDQEPLDFEYFQSDDVYDQVKQIAKSHFAGQDDLLEHYYENCHTKKFYKDLNLRAYLMPSIFPTLLLHSEVNSKTVDKYRALGMIPIYYWAHALISRDWYRYAEHDPMLQDKSLDFTYDFIMYNRAWTGTREYRLAMLSRLVDRGLFRSVMTRFPPYDTGLYYLDHDFRNKNFTNIRNDLHKIFEPNLHPSHASADYSAADYAQCSVDIVMETIFDDQRCHLTEKILRPIACGKPFMLASGPGSLKYLRAYGFKTFEPWINETYDSEPDSSKRLDLLLNEVERISNLSRYDKLILWQRLHTIAEYNQTWFFSKEFFEKIVDEFRQNSWSAIKQCRNVPSKDHIMAYYNHALCYQPNPYLETAKKMTEKVDEWFTKRNHDTP